MHLLFARLPGCTGLLWQLRRMRGHLYCHGLDGSWATAHGEGTGLPCDARRLLHCPLPTLGTNPQPPPVVLSACPSWHCPQCSSSLYLLVLPSAAVPRLALQLALAAHTRAQPASRMPACAALRRRKAGEPTTLGPCACIRPHAYLAQVTIFVANVFPRAGLLGVRTRSPHAIVQ